jgi:hypothetical protein
MIKLLQKTGLFIALSCLGTGVFAQGVIKGKIVDADAESFALMGATVVVEGTTVGTAANLDGTFVLKVQQEKVTLVFSYMGYIDETTEVTIPASGERDLGVIKLKPNTVGLDEVQISVSYVRDRQTPVAVSTIEPYIIAEKLGTQEFPEILKTTPSVYATKGSGGFGDSRIYLRGFDTNNIGYLINGIPVNDMENGKVYFSNWAGLADVTENQQVQRGLGASKLALSSVGGTINIITKSTDVEKGGSIYSGIGNDGYRKYSFNVSTGLLENGWAVTLSGAKNFGDGYIKGTNFDGYSYFLNISKILNEQHRLVFNAFGAPQWHNQRNQKHFIQDYREHPDGARWNSDYGYRNGKIYGTGYAYNFYHKPQISLSHYWNINESSLLSTQVYASMSSGGGRRVAGANSGWLSRSFPTGEVTDDTKLTPEGYYDYDYVINQNSSTTDGKSLCIISNAINQHDWYGILSSYTMNLGVLKITGGFDGRFYRGYHYVEIEDLLGGDYYTDATNVNSPDNKHLFKGDKISYYNLGDVLWTGFYGQGEYITDKYSAFVSASLAQKNYRRIDYFKYTGDEQTSEWVRYIPWNLKGGFNYKLNDQHNLYINSGLVANAPIFSNAFLNNTNVVNRNIKYEKIMTGEIGYNILLSNFELKSGFYITSWKERAFVKSLNNNHSGLLTGLNALHKGLEIETTYKPDKRLVLKGMLSYGDYLWTDDANMTEYDENQDYEGESPVYIKNVHVGNSAQVTASFSCDYEILPKLKVGTDITYFGKNFADYEPSTRGDITDAVDAWQMPDAIIVDINANYKFKIGKLNATIYGNVFNLLNTEYITDATDGTNHDQYTSPVWFGFGRTWSSGMRIYF